MELIPFLKWWYRTSSTDEKAGTTAVITVVLFLLATFAFGFLKALIGLFITFITLVLIFGIIIPIYKHVNKRWTKFKEYREREAQDIVDKLAGHKARRF